MACYFCDKKDAQVRCSDTKVFFCDTNCQTNAFNDVNNNYREMIGAPVKKKGNYRTIVATYSTRGSTEKYLKLRISQPFSSEDKAESFFTDVFKLWLDQNEPFRNDEDSDDIFSSSKYYPFYHDWDITRGRVEPEDLYISYIVYKVPSNHKYMIAYANTYNDKWNMKKIFFRILTGETKKDVKEEFRWAIGGETYKEAIEIAKQRKAVFKKNGQVLSFVFKNLFETKRK